MKEIDFARMFASIDPVIWLQFSNRNIKSSPDHAMWREFLETYRMIMTSMDSVSPNLLRRVVKGALPTHTDSQLLLGGLLAIARERVSSGQFTIESIYPKLPKIRSSLKAHPNWPIEFLQDLKRQGVNNPFFQKRLQIAIEDFRALTWQSGLHGAVELDNAPESGAGGSGAPPDGGAEGGTSGGTSSGGTYGWGEEDVWGLPFWCLGILAAISAVFP